MIRTTIIILSVATGIFIGEKIMKSASYVPKFQAGDCAKFVFEADEFTERRLGNALYYIERVGKEKYLITEDYGGLWKLQETKDIKIFDRANSKVDCETGEEM